MRERLNWLTGADPIADAGEPLGVGGGVDVDEDARLLTAVAEGPEGVVPVLASPAFPVPFSPFSHCLFSPKSPLSRENSEIFSFWSKQREREREKEGTKRKEGFEGDTLVLAFGYGDCRERKYPPCVYFYTT